MAIGEIKVSIKLKRWAKPLVFALVLFKMKKLVGRWAFNVVHVK